MEVITSASLFDGVLTFNINYLCEFSCYYPGFSYLKFWVWYCHCFISSH